MIYREPLEDTLANRVRNLGRNLVGEAIRWAWDLAADVGSIGPGSPRARRFAAFGEMSVVCFPYGSHVNEAHVAIGHHTVIAPHVVLSAGWGPGHEGLPDVVVRLGDRCLIGRGSSLIGCHGIEIGDDVWTGYDVRIADMNHAYEDVTRPIGVQSMPIEPVTVGDGSWLGHHVIVLPGVTIGRHVTVGAGSVVTTDLPDNSVAVGAPARVVRQWTPDDGWVRASVLGPGWQEAAAELAAMASDDDSLAAEPPTT